MTWPWAAIVIAAIFATAWVIRMAIVAAASTMPPFQQEQPTGYAQLSLVHKEGQEQDDSHPS